MFQTYLAVSDDQKFSLKNYTINNSTNIPIFPGKWETKHLKDLKLVSFS